MSTQAERALLRLCERLPERRGAGPDALGDRRREAATLLRETGLPTSRQEAWRFTNLDALDRLDWSEPGPAAPATADLPELARALEVCHRLFFLDGRFVPERSAIGALPAGARIGAVDPLDGALPAGFGSVCDPKDRSIVALNLALLDQVAHVELDAGVALDRPVLLVHATSGTQRAVHPRSLLSLGAGSCARILELHVAAGSDAVLSNPVTEARLGEGAVLDHVHLQQHAPGSVHLGVLAVTQEASSRLGSHSVALGGALARLEIDTRLGGPGAHARLHGLSAGRDRQLLDHYTTIDHAAPETTSEELYKAILRDRARGVFCGRVHVRPHAQKIDATQTNRALLLSDSAAMHTRPQLEIHADDVRCSHGASIGQLDDDALFYLRARGIALEDARALLTTAFAEDVLATLPWDAVRARVRSALALDVHPEPSPSEERI